MHISDGADPRDERGNQGTVHVQRTETVMWWTIRRSTSGKLTSVLRITCPVEAADVAQLKLFLLL